MAKRDPNVLLDPYADAPAPDSAAPPSYDQQSAGGGGALPARPGSATDLGQRPGPLPRPAPSRRDPDEPAPPTVPAKRRKRRGLALLVGTLIAGVIAGGGYAGYRYFGQRTAPMFPDAKLAFLPESTVLVQRISREQLVTDSMFLTPNEQALWSQMAATSCGGTDVYAHLMSANLELSKQVLTAALDIRHDTAKALGCGREMAKRLGPTLYLVHMEGEREIRREPERRRFRDEPPEDPGPQKAPLLSVTLYDVGRGELPESTEGFIERRDRSGLLGTRCAVESGRRFADCWSGSVATAKLEGSPLWVSGRVAEIEAFGREFSPKASNTLEEAKQFEALALEVEKFPSAKIGKWTAFDVSFIRRIGCGAPFTSWDGTAFNVKLNEAVTKFKSVWAIGDSLGIDGGDMRFFFLPETEGESVDLVLDLKDWHESAKEFFDKLEEPDMGGSEEVKTTEREYRTAIHKSCVRSLRKAEVDRSGKLVTLSFNTDIEPGEKDAIDDMIRDVEDRRKAASKIVDQLIAGERPDFDLLDDLGGKELVDAVKHKNQPAKPEL